MKLAVLSDIHANFTALEAVVAHIEAWGPDAVVVAGDVVNRGPRPLECLRQVQAQVRSKGWGLVRGNHEDYVVAQARPDAARSGPAAAVHLPSYWTLQKLGCDPTPLEAMPFFYSLSAPDGSEVRVVHASMRGIRDGIYPKPYTTDQDLSHQIQPAPPLFCVGHTHFPLVRSLRNTLIVNAGSVGLPFDGDRRASYAQITWKDGEWHPRIVRVEYDLVRAERDFTVSGYLAEAGPLIELVLMELRSASPLLGAWAHRFQKQALAGEISVAASVRAFLAKE